MTDSGVGAIGTRVLKLHSPAGVEPAVFTWPTAEQQDTKKDGIFVGGDEIVKTIMFVFEDHPELYQQNLDLNNCDIHSYFKMKELCDKFNKIIDTHLKLNRGTEAFSARLQQRATAKLFRHILAQVYSRAVTDPEKLRDYTPFSPSVYGETSPDLIDSIIKIIHLTEDQTFIDLGSGVGNVVLHVAALTNCKHVYGIEHEETPATYAQAMGDEFRCWMRWYGKRYAEFELERGDFLSHPSIDERIKEADVIFANNYVFGSAVNHELKMKFMNMKDGAKIVSSREFCPETFRLNDRTKNDLGAVMHVTKPEEFLGKVSWSDKCVQYYLHVIDHSKLAHYYEKTHHHHAKSLKSSHSKSNDDDPSLSPLSNNSSSTSSPPTHTSSSSKNSRQPKSIRANKTDENEPPLSRTKPIKRKRKLSSSTTTTTTRTPPPSSVPTMISARGRKIQVKIIRDKHESANEHDDSEFESDLSDPGTNNVKRRRVSSKNYHSTLAELHTAAETLIQPTGTISKEHRFNHRDMTKLSHENLDMRHFRDCLLEQEDRRFLDSINSYLDKFRQRLFAYFTYMKSDIYREHLRRQLDNEIELNQTLKAKVNCLETNIKALLDDAIDLLKIRTAELGIEQLERPVQLITYANDISSKHKELRSKVASLEKEILDYDVENEKMTLILKGLESNGHEPPPSSAVVAPTPTDNTYSSLLVSMSRQTQQQLQREQQKEITKPSYSSISPSIVDKDLPLPMTPRSSHTQKISTPSYSVVKSERKSDFIIQKRAKKTGTSNPNDHALVSPIKLIKVIDKSNGPPPSHPSIPLLTTSSNVGNLLSTKQLEPVQVHSIVSSTGHQIKQHQHQRHGSYAPVLHPINVKTLLNNTQTSSISSTKYDDSTIKLQETSRAMIMQSPRKKRDFYGKSSGPSTTSTPSPLPVSTSHSLFAERLHHRSRHLHTTTNPSTSNHNNRPSSTPACPTAPPIPTLPDRPVSIPPLKTSS